VRERSLPLLRDPLVLAAVLMVVAALPSVLNSENASRAARDWASYWKLVVYAWVAANVLAARARELVFWTLAVSSTLACVLALVQSTGGVDLGAIHIPGRYRAGGTLYTMTFAGIIYQLIVLNCALLLTHAMSARRRLFLAATVAIQLAAIMFTMTRGAWLALAAGLVAVCVMARNKVAVGAAIALVSALAVFAVTSHKGRSIPEMVRSGLDIDASTRVVLWDIAWDLFRENPVFGVGMGDFSIEADRRLAGRRVTTTVDAHNIYLQVLSTRGLVGFLPFAWLWFVLLRELFRSKQRLARGSLDYGYVVGAIATTVAVLVGGLTELNIDDGEVLMAFVLVIGLARARDYSP
jgi:O-antigen ligase